MSPAARTPMTETEIDRLRTMVPDDPIKLPSEHLACEGCGVAVPDRPSTTTTVTPAPTSNPARRDRVEFSRCVTCQSVMDQAEAYVAARPGMLARHGHLAVERVASVLFALIVLDRPVPEDPGRLLPRLQPVGHGMWFSSPLALTQGMCSPHPWAHVTLTQRADLRAAYVAALRDRLAQSAPPVTLPCPRIACLFCGIASVQRSAVEVAQRGGPENAAESVWTRVITDATALGIRGPRRFVGDVCPDCARALEQTGAVGLEARAQALVSYVARTSMKKAERLRDLVEGKNPPTLPAWAVAVNPLRPNSEPWGHLRRITDRL